MADVGFTPGGGSGGLTDRITSDIDAGVDPISAVFHALSNAFQAALAEAGGWWRADGVSTWFEP